MAGRKKIMKGDEKAFHVRMPKETWEFLRKASFVKEVTIKDFVIDAIEKQRNKLCKKYEELSDFVLEKEVETKE